MAHATVILIQQGPTKFKTGSQSGWLREEAVFFVKSRFFPPRLQAPTLPVVTWWESSSSPGPFEAETAEAHGTTGRQGQRQIDHDTSRNA